MSAVSEDIRDWLDGEIRAYRDLRAKAETGAQFEDASVRLDTLQRARVKLVGEPLPQDDAGEPLPDATMTDLHRLRDEVANDAKTMTMTNDPAAQYAAHIAKRLSGLVK